MAKTYRATFAALLGLELSVGSLGTLKPQLNLQKTLVQGAADWQISQVFFQLRTIVAGAPLTLVMSDGSMKDPNGDGAVFAKVVAWGVQNLDVTNDLTIGAAALHPWETWTSAGGTKLVKKGSGFIDSSGPGYAVGAGASDQLKIVASAGSVDCIIAIVGQ